MPSLKKIRHRICGLLFCVSLFSSVGGQWAILQSAAWTSMLWNYTHSAPRLTPQAIKQAATKTFDGNHPCQFCKMISKAKSQEKPKAALVAFKMNPFIRPNRVHTPILLPEEGTHWSLAPKIGSPILRTSPPTKPPQNV